MKCTSRSGLLALAVLLGCNTGSERPAGEALSPATAAAAMKGSLRPPQPLPPQAALAGAHERTPDAGQCACRAPAPGQAAPALDADESPPPPSQPQEPSLFADDGSLLPQTEARPGEASEVYQHHLRLLFDAIVKDEPEIARPFFFPVEAYEQVKAIEKPARDWQHRLWRNFVRDVHAYHAQLGVDPEGAVLARLEVREAGIRWMKPHSEGNKLGYFRVTRSQIHGQRADGTPLRLELTSMISWRGEWYVVHLHGFR